MKAILSILLSMALAGADVYAEDMSGGVREERSIVDSLSVRSEGRITVAQPWALAKRVERDTTTVGDDAGSRTELRPGTKVVHKSGYRIQVYSDNNQRMARANAEKIASQISAEYPLLGTYLVYKAPYWRLKVGDFLTREDAVEMMAELKKSFGRISGEMIIVRDRINIIE